MKIVFQKSPSDGRRHGIHQLRIFSPRHRPQSPWLFGWRPGLVNVYITMENHHFSWENSLFQWPCSIANCWHNQRVALMAPLTMVKKRPAWGGTTGSSWESVGRSKSRPPWPRCAQGAPPCRTTSRRDCLQGEGWSHCAHTHAHLCIHMYIYIYYTHEID